MDNWDLCRQACDEQINALEELRKAVAELPDSQKRRAIEQYLAGAMVFMIDASLVAREVGA